MTDREMMIHETIHMIYPEDCYVTPEAIIGWAHDALINEALNDYVRLHGPLPEGPDGDLAWDLIAAGQQVPDLAGAIEILSDRGSHTFARS
jgi:hypothetical protein